MKCSICGETATKVAEYSVPGRPETRRGVCDSPTCAPKEPTGWKFYPVKP